MTVGILGFPGWDDIVEISGYREKRLRKGDYYVDTDDSFVAGGAAGGIGGYCGAWNCKRQA